MDNKEIAKNQLGQYLQSKGINTRKNFKCIDSSKHSNDDKIPSMGYKDNMVHCFACGFSGDIFDVIGHEYNISETDHAAKFKKTYEILGMDSDIINTPISKKRVETAITISIDEIKKMYSKAHSNLSKTDYFTQRGISQELQEKYKVGYLKEYDNEFIIVPCTDTFYVKRNLKKHEFRNLAGGQIDLFNGYYLDQDNDEPIFIVEGVFDALSVEEVGYRAISLNGWGNYKIVVEKLSQNDKKPYLILFLDNDVAGKNATIELEKRLSDLDIPFMDIGKNSEHKDANEYLLNDREGFIEFTTEAVTNMFQIIENEEELILKEYQKASVSNYIQEFVDGISDRVSTKAFPTGFDKLDDVLNGGLYEGLYVMGAISSLGKTTYALQMADQMAEQGIDVMIFSLEMARTELMAKSISRKTYKDKSTAKHARSTKEITTGKIFNSQLPGGSRSQNTEEKEWIVEAVKSYAAFSDHLYIYEGVGDIGVNKIRELVEKHIRIKKTKPVIFIDYLQILQPFDVRASDKQNIDKAVLELKRMSRDLKVPVIAISSFNRMNYENKVSFGSFKESGAVEYSSDVLIGLQLKGVGEEKFDADEAKKENPRAIEVVILKNRNGETGRTISYQYNTKCNLFVEDYKNGH